MKESPSKVQILTGIGWRWVAGWTRKGDRVTTVNYSRGIVGSTAEVERLKRAGHVLRTVTREQDLEEVYGSLR